MMELTIREEDIVLESYKKKFFKMIEEKLDEWNAEQEPNMLCVCCGTRDFDGKEGVVHRKDCLMNRLRKKIGDK